MNTGSMKNIVVLKDLPSNLVDEAIIFLKENQKLKKLETADVDIKQNKDKAKIVGDTSTPKNQKDYIINEAQMLIADYISRLENKSKKENISYKKLKKKYDFLKKVSLGLTVLLAVSIVLQFII